MKKFIIVVLALFVSFTLVGCQKDPMQLMWFDDGSEGEVMQELLDDYFAETGVEIELITVAYNDLETTLATRVAGGDAPALARVTEGNLNNLQASILSLEGVYDETGFTNLFYNTAGDVISLPMDITANGMFINTDLCDAAGVNYDFTDGDIWTWDEFETEMLKLNNLDASYNLATPGIIDNKAHRFMPGLVYSTGTVIWDSAYTTTNLTDQAIVDQVQRFMDYFDEGFFDDEVYTADSTAALFRTGQYGFHISGNWNVSSYQDLPFNWTVVEMPTGANGERGTVLGGKSLAAFADSGYEQEAKDFIAWMAEADNHDAYTGGVPYLTPRLGATVDYGDYADEYAVFLDEIANTSDAAIQDWVTQVLIPGMYGIINPFAEEIALNPDDRTALQILTDLETALIEAMEEDE